MGTITYATRTKVTSSVYSKKTTYTEKEKVSSVKNTSKYEATKSASLTDTTSRTYSFSASADIPLSCLKDDVKATKRYLRNMV